MFPIALNLHTLPILLIGEGEAFEKRKEQLQEAGAKKVMCHGSWVMGEKDFVSAHIVMVVGLTHSESEMIAAEARKAGKLVNVEDVPELCDFYFMSLVTRGDLTIAVSTNGASPTIAKRVRDYIARRFGDEWAGFLEEMKVHRLQLRAQGKTMKEVMIASDHILQEKAWLDCRRCKKKDAA